MSTDLGSGEQMIEIFEIGNLDLLGAHGEYDASLACGRAHPLVGELTFVPIAKPAALHYQIF